MKQIETLKEKEIDGNLCMECDNIIGKIVEKKIEEKLEDIVEVVVDSISVEINR